MKALDKLSEKDLGKIWIIFALLCLFLSGAIALVITFAKLPLLSDSFKDIDLIRWILVIHVNLATLMWFTAFPLGLIYFKTVINKKINLYQYISLIISVIGVLLVITTLPTSDLNIYMSNYIPVLSSNQFLAGLVFYLLGTGMSYILSPVFKNRNLGPLVGSVYFILALVTLMFAFNDLYFNAENFRLDYYEKLMWGFGHLLQHSSSAFAFFAGSFYLKKYSQKSIYLQL
ncbi:MAG: hypothetical protein MK008_13965 [Bdellovibrionales bacterium]|nr:hypothetical protein [Bdellovibrionales bacterium]